MPIIRHCDQALIQHSYRRIVTRTEGAMSCTLWDQTLPPSGIIPMHAHNTEETLTILAGQLTITLDSHWVMPRLRSTCVGGFCSPVFLVWNNSEGAYSF